MAAPASKCLLVRIWIPHSLLCLFPTSILGLKQFARDVLSKLAHHPDIRYHRFIFIVQILIRVDLKLTLDLRDKISDADGLTSIKKHKDEIVFVPSSYRSCRCEVWSLNVIPFRGSVLE